MRMTVAEYVANGWMPTDASDYVESISILAEVVPRIVRLKTTPPEELAQPKGITFFNVHQKYLEQYEALKNYHSKRADKLLEKYTK